MTKRYVQSTWLVGALTLTFAAACADLASDDDRPPVGPVGTEEVPPSKTTDRDGGSAADAPTTEPPTDASPAADAAPDASGAPQVLFPRTGITADELGIVVNDSDPLSVSVAAYYVTARNIPASHVVHVQIPTTTVNFISEAAFAPVKTQVDAAFAGTPVQALLLTWTKPYGVGNMSITSAFAMGYKPIANTCTDPNSQYAAQNPYLANRASTRPFADLHFRPTMTIPATTLAEAKATIDHGVASDNTWPAGSAYLMHTSDQVRSARCVVNPNYGYTNQCQALIDKWDSSGSNIGASIVNADSITNKTDVLFYVQGLASVPNIGTNTFLPGAIADHLTSYGGQIPTSGQMSAFMFLKGGATASYGTVVEPCAYTQKFPDPTVLVPAYFGGNTLIEAYWKSVAWPAEGIFIGEPLARPFGKGFRSKLENGTLVIETTAMVPGKTYLIEAADAEAGPFTTALDNLTVPKYRRASFSIPNAKRAFYKFRAH